MATTDYDCSLDLHEAIQLLELMFFTFERADTQQDWFTLRQPIGSGIYAVERILRQAMRTVEGAAAQQVARRMN